MVDMLELQEKAELVLDAYGIACYAKWMVLAMKG
jgi:hypothetical protein